MAKTYKRVEKNGKWFMEVTTTTNTVRVANIPLADFEAKHAKNVAELELITELLKEQEDG